MTTQTRTALAMALAFAIAVGGGVLVASGLSGDDSASDVASGPTIPVLGPDAVGDPLPDETLSPPDKSGGGGGGGGSGGGGGAVDGPVVGAGTGPEGGALPEPGAAAELTPPDDLGRDAGARSGAVDPCAGSEAGAGPEEGCDGADGVGGTVLASLDAIPLDIINVAVARVPECVDRFGNVDDGEYPVVIISNTAGDFTISRGPVGGPLGDPVSVSTSDRERARVAEATSERVHPGTYNCVLFTGIERGTTALAVHVEGVNDAGFTDTEDRVLEIPTLKQRPPVEITPVGGHRLSIDVPVKEDQHAVVQGSVAGDSGVGCPEIERDGPPRPLAVDAVNDDSHEIPRSVRRSPGYAYDAEYVRVEHLDAVLSPRATRFVVCVFWLHQSRSFSPERVVEREHHVVSRPGSYVVTMDIAGIEGERGFDAGTLDVLVHTPDGGALCQYQNDVLVLPGLGDEPLESCASQPTDGLDAQVRVGNRVGDHWRTREAELRLRRDPCRGEGRSMTCEAHLTEWFRVAIPGRSQGLCGSGLGDCPRSDSPGTVVLRLDYEAPSGPVFPEWELANEGSYDAPTTVEPVAPPYPQLDLFSASVTPVDVTAVEKGIDILFPVVDRPLSGARAFLDDTSARCTIDAARATAATVGDTRSLQLRGLCPGVYYGVVLQLTDTAGATATYTWAPGAYAAPSFAWPAAFTMTAPTPAYLQMTMTAEVREDGALKPPSQQVGVERIHVEIANRSAIRFRDRENAAPWYCEELNGGGAEGTAYSDSVFSAYILVEANLLLHPGQCDRRGFAGRVNINIFDSVSLLTLLTGEHVVIQDTTTFGAGESIVVTLDFSLLRGP